MKITSLYVYPIKGLRGIALDEALIGPLGIRHDRTFMLYEIKSDTGKLTKVQVDSHPRCARFWQQIKDGGDEDGGSDAQLAVTFREPSAPAESPGDTLTMPLQPSLAGLGRITVDLHGSLVEAYRMAESYEAWFAARLGVPVAFVCLGDSRRKVLGNTLRPPAKQEQQAGGGWLSSVTSYLGGGGGGAAGEKPPAYITFADAGALLVTSEVSLRQVNTRLPRDQPTAMFKFRPNLVVDGAGEEEWAEDYWAELTVGGDGRKRLLLTGNCVRCTSLNVDYDTGKMAVGELGTVLKKLAKDRRVDPGHKWSPVFGRYGFPAADGDELGFTVRVGEDVEVTGRNTERTAWDWPGM